MKRSYLKGLGLTQEQIDSIMEENGSDIENAKEKAKEKYDIIIEKLQSKIELLEEKPNNPKPKETKKDEDDEIKKLKDELELLKAGGKVKEDKKSNSVVEEVDDKSGDNDPLKKLQEEFASYKQNVELEKVSNMTSALLTKILEAKGANPKFIPLLKKEFDLSKLEIEGEGDKQTIKGIEDLLKPVQESYSDIFGEVIEDGVKVSNPPKQKPGDANPTTLQDALNQKYGTK